MTNDTTHFHTNELPEDIRRLQRPALIGGGIALALCVLGLLFHPRHFFQSYLLGYMLVLGATLGGMALLLLHHLTGGSWGVPIRRIVEAITRNVPLVTLMFLPLLAGIHYLYEWAHPEIVEHDEVLQGKEAYLNVGFFVIRAIIYFAAWNAIAFVLNRGSRQLDRTRSIDTARRISLFSGPCILLYVLTMTFASFDWMMSLEPHWYSTMYGLLTVVGQVLNAFAVVAILLAWLSRRPPLRDIVNPGHFHDIGNLTLAFVMLWAYMSLSQFLIIWSGNVSEETPWYIARTHHGWGAVGLLLIIFHFAVPFALLLSRRTKRDPRLLSKLAMLIIVMRAVDLFWWIAPALSNMSEHGHVANPNERYFNLSYMDFLAPIGLGAIWLAALIWQLGRRSLVPIGLLDEGTDLAGQHA